MSRQKVFREDLPNPGKPFVFAGTVKYFTPLAAFFNISLQSILAKAEFPKG